jgi:hypothetical protein
MLVTVFSYGRAQEHNLNLHNERFCDATQKYIPPEIKWMLANQVASFVAVLFVLCQDQDPEADAWLNRFVPLKAAVWGQCF